MKNGNTVSFLFNKRRHLSTWHLHPAGILNTRFRISDGVQKGELEIPHEFFEHTFQMVCEPENRRYESLISSKPIPAHTESYISYLFLIIHALTFKVEAYGPHNQLKANKLSFWTHPISLDTLTRKGLTKFENPYKNKILKKIKLILNLYTWI